MSSGYKSGNYRNYNSGRYMPSHKKRNRKLIQLRNRIIIVTCGVLICTLIITLFSLFLKNCVCAGCDSNRDVTIPTETIDTSATQPSTGSGQTLQNQALSFITPAINDDGTSKGNEDGGLYIYKGAAYKGFRGETKDAEDYAKVIKSAKKSLGADVNVFSMLVPTHIDMGVPERLRNTENGVETKSQTDYLKTAYEAMGDSVHPVNVYNPLAQHCNDKIYFNTDYRWTALGAYYGYTAFTDVAGVRPVTLESMTKKSISDYEGYYKAGYELDLDNETIDYYESEDYDVSIDITNTDGEVTPAYSCFYEVEAEPTEKFMVFLQGDYPLEVITSSSTEAKDKICIIHESFGNPIISYFTYNYKEVYSIDMSKWTGNLKEFCEENEIKNVLFINDTASSANEDTLAQIKEMLK